MPFADLGQARIHYEISGDPSQPVLVLSTSLGSNLSMWEAQVPAFEKRFRVLRYDMRGHGQSSSPPSPYSVAQLAQDLLELTDSLRINRFHLCGLSVGGMIGMHLGLTASQRLGKLVLCNTAAKIGTLESWNARIELVRVQGMKGVAEITPARWFTSSFAARSPEIVAKVMAGVEALDPDGYVGGCCAVRDFDARAEVSRISLPTLVISGTHDPATPPAEGRFLAAQIPNARYVELDASHISSIEAPDRVKSEVLSFLSE